MWVPVKRSAEDMFVDMGEPVAAAPVGQLAQAVQVHLSPFSSFLPDFNIDIISNIGVLSLFNLIC